MTWEFATLNSASPADALATKLETAMSANGFTKVEDYTISTTKYRVWNSNNGFHTIISHSTANTGNVYLATCETYNSSNHTCGYVAYGANTAGRVTNYLRTDYGYSSTLNGPATGFTLDSSNLSRVSVGTTTTTFTYGFSVTSQRVILTSYVGTTTYDWIYSGRFDPWMTVERVGSGGVVDPGPFCTAIYSNSYWTVATTRSLDVSKAGTSNNGWGNCLWDTWGPVYGTPTTPNANYGGITVASLYVYQPYNLQAWRGKLYGVGKAAADTAAYNYGDELVVNGVSKWKIVNNQGAVIEMI